MGEVNVQLPAVLAEMVDGERRFSVRGDTIGEALHDLVRQQPGLGMHFFDDSGAMRRHILCFHNDYYARGREGLRTRRQLRRHDHHPELRRRGIVGSGAAAPQSRT